MPVVLRLNKLWVVRCLCRLVSCRGCLQVLLNVLSGMIYFQEYHDMPWSNLFLFMTGYV